MITSCLSGIHEKYASHMSKELYTDLRCILLHLGTIRNLDMDIFGSTVLNIPAWDEEVADTSHVRGVEHDTFRIGV